MRIKNKIFICLILLFILILNISNSYASFDFINPDKQLQSIPDLPSDITNKAYIFIAVYSNVITVCGRNTPFVYQENSPNWSSYGYDAIEMHGSVAYKLENNKWVSRSTNNWDMVGYKAPFKWIKPLYSNKDILYINSSEVFFFKAPPHYQIPMMTTAEQIPSAMVGVMKMIIPAGLIIFGMGLLIYLIRWAISRVQ